MATISRIQQYEVQTGHISSQNHAQSHQFRHQDPQPPLALWLNRVGEMHLMLHLQGCRSDEKKNKVYGKIISYNFIPMLLL